MRSGGRRCAEIVVGRSVLRRVDAAVATAASPVMMREPAGEIEKGLVYTIPSSSN